jgi:hypothetical protein
MVRGLDGAQAVLRERLMTFTSFSGGFTSAITKPEPELIGPVPVNHLRGDGRSRVGHAAALAARTATWLRDEEARVFADQKRHHAIAG